MNEISLWPPSLVVDPDSPRPLPSATVAHQLSRIQRFNGATPEPYSVAQHTLLVVKLLSQVTDDPNVLLAGLTHDAEEVVFGDIITPLKQWFGSADSGGFGLLDDWRIAICSGFGVLTENIDCDAVKDADRRALNVERMAIRGEAAAVIGCEPLTLHEVHSVSKLPQTIAQTRSEWLSSFRTYGGIG